MFEAHVLFLLRKYLGEYVEGLSNEALRISVWKGDVVLKDLKLKAEALNNLKLPVTVKAGFVGTITLKVPWKSLGKEPVVVLIDRVFLLAHPAPDGQSLKDEDRERLFEAKLQQIEEAELAIIEARRTKAGAPPVGNSWLGSLIATIIGNLKVSISNVHIRYEDSISNPGHPFCCGVTLSKLAAVTTDELGNETFDASGALDKLRKSVQLQRLAAYHDSDSTPWKPNKKWEDLNPTEWAEIFQDGIDELRSGRDSIWAMNRRYLVSPINGVLIYHRLGKQERHNADIPFERALLVLSDVSLTVSEEQYYDAKETMKHFLDTRHFCGSIMYLRPVVLSLNILMHGGIMLCWLGCNRRKCDLPLLHLQALMVETPFLQGYPSDVEELVQSASFTIFWKISLPRLNFLPVPTANNKSASSFTMLELCGAGNQF
ncbi:putative vacuolar protein sorting-associated protein 13F [Dioscorea cayenensis subsp. rotundata]|uniref:Vacuolar protein sorting-associated protein 13F n=1 Tax=Dioscorea cayennensis subsp. rotundata TaxID=55577 RepID=A0AB40B9Y7_DIOCR|nr:putative vacuolar protein sorting-associated protein 13F [Dioscorea cayenensis subsp. rotundata]